MRTHSPLRSLLLGLSLPFAALAGCGDNGFVGVGGGGSTGAAASEVGRATSDEMDAVVAGLTTDNTGGPQGYPVLAGCPAVSASADGDADGIPDDQTFTFANPPCAAPSYAGGAFGLVGTVELQDLSAGDTTSFGITLTNLAWSLVDASGTRTYSATRSGTRTRVGTEDTASVATSITVTRTRPGKAVAHLTHTTTLNFVAAVAGTLSPKDPLPDGTISVTGTITWNRATESFSFAVSTPVPLVYEASCSAAAQRFTAGEMHLTGTINGVAGDLVLIWTGCGHGPSITFIAA